LHGFYRQVGVKAGTWFLFDSLRFIFAKTQRSQQHSSGIEDASGTPLLLQQIQIVKVSKSTVDCEGANMNRGPLYSNDTIYRRPLLEWHDQGFHTVGGILYSLSILIFFQPLIYFTEWSNGYKNKPNQVPVTMDFTYSRSSTTIAESLSI
jgi:hypothetical protein